MGLCDAVQQLRGTQKLVARYLAIYNGRRCHMALQVRTLFQQLNRLRVTE
jgi:hypothetical protein